MIWLGIFALLQEVLYLVLLHLGPIVEKDVGKLPEFLGLWGLTFGLFFASLLFIQKKQVPLKSGLALILISGLIFRLTVFFLPLVLSNDLLYYIWYGRLQSHGVNPYLYSVQAPELAWLRDSVVWANIPYKEIVPVYPAFIMKIFHLAHLVGGDSLLGFKILQFIPETVTCVAGIALLRAYDRSPLKILLYAWCPLPIVEYLGMGHSDTWAIAMLTLFLLCWKKSRVKNSAMALACGTLVKFIPVVWLPLVVKRLKNRDRFAWLLVFTLTCFVLYLPFYSARHQMIGLLPKFIQSYEFNGSLYQVIHALLGRGDYSHFVVNGLILVGALLVAWRARDWPRALMATLLVFFIGSYQIFPWYLGYFLPLLLITSCWGVYAWLFTSLFSYQVLMNFLWNGNWVESPWILLAEYLPFYGLLLAQGIFEARIRGKKTAKVIDETLAVRNFPLTSE